MGNREEEGRGHVLPCFVEWGSGRDNSLPPQLPLNSVRAFEENSTLHPMARDTTLDRMVTWVRWYRQVLKEPPRGPE